MGSLDSRAFLPVMALPSRGQGREPEHKWGVPLQARMHENQGSPLRYTLANYPLTKKVIDIMPRRNIFSGLVDRAIFFSNRHDFYIETIKPMCNVRPNSSLGTLKD